MVASSAPQKDHSLFGEVAKREVVEESRELSETETNAILRSGVLVTRDGFPIIEPGTDISGVGGRGLFTDLGAFHKMISFDGSISGIDLLISRTIQGANWVISDIQDASKQEKEGVELARAYLGVTDEGNRDVPYAIMTGGMSRLVQHGLKMHPYGCSVMEYDWEISEFGGRKIVVPTLEWRAPWSFNRVIYNGDKPVAIEQVLQLQPLSTASRESTDRSTQNQQKFRIIPLNKCIVWTHDGVDGNIFGRPLYKAAYPWYSAKIDTVKLDLRFIDQLIYGVLIIEELGTKDGVFEEVDATSIAMIADLYNQYRDGKISCLWQPFGVKLNQEWPAKEAPDPSKRIGYYDDQIKASIGSMFFGPGSIAPEEAQESFQNILTCMANDTAAVINGIPGVQHTGIVRKLIDANVATHKDFRYPQVRPVGIGTSVSKMVTMMSRAAQFLLYSGTAKDEVLFREKMGLSRIPIDEIEKIREKVSQKAGQMSQQGTQSTQGCQASPEKLRSKKEGSEKEGSEKEEK